MEITREKIGGFIGAVVVGILILLLLLFSYFSIAHPPQGIEGIPVMFGSVNEAGGWTESQKNETPSAAPQQQKPTDISEESLITQATDEPTLTVQEKKEKERLEQLKREEEQRRQEDLRRKKQEKERRKEINKKMSGLFGEADGSKGEVEGAGLQGASTGNTTKGAPTGSGGIGSYDLGGRSLGPGGLAQPGYSVNDYGTVVVKITVDPKGNVVHAEIGRGTNTPSSTLRSEALRAARRTKFNAIQSPNNQQGTITYTFNLH